MDEGSESYMNFQSERGADKSGGERVVEPISLLERRIHLWELKSSSPVLVQTFPPPPPPPPPPHTPLRRRGQGEGGAGGGGGGGGGGGKDGPLRKNNFSENYF